MICGDCDVFGPLTRGRHARSRRFFSFVGLQEFGVVVGHISASDIIPRPHTKPPPFAHTQPYSSEIETGELGLLQGNNLMRA
jgi:hypothetical protein